MDLGFENELHRGFSTSFLAYACGLSPERSEVIVTIIGVRSPDHAAALDSTYEEYFSAKHGKSSIREVEQSLLINA